MINISGNSRLPDSIKAFGCVATCPDLALSDLQRRHEKHQMILVDKRLLGGPIETENQHSWIKMCYNICFNINVLQITI